jgi:CBS domain-containing protein
MSGEEGVGRALRAMTVREVMTRELVTCAAEVPLREAAHLMAAHRIHSVVVLASDAAGEPGWAVLSDLDLVGAAPWDVEGTTAGMVAASPRALVPADASLEAAARAMAEYGTAHLLVTEPDAARPVGILSALDIAAAVAPPPPAPAPRVVAARPGDRLVIAPHHQGEPPRDAEVLEARGAGGGPPYLVRWEDTGRVSLHYPGPDAAIARAARGASPG